MGEANDPGHTRDLRRCGRDKTSCCKRETMMKFGASSWPFQWDPPYEDAIRRISSLGFRAIELIAWNKDFLTDYYTDAKISDLKAVLKGEGIALSQFVSTPHDLSSSDKSERDAAVEHWKRAVDVGA